MTIFIGSFYPEIPAVFLLIIHHRHVFLSFGFRFREIRAYYLLTIGCIKTIFRNIFLCTYKVFVKNSLR